ncbi:FAD-binding oxidoreductase [Palleronia pelagia]|uniref:FAD/FMN-containing dehydrogenase n=1 Tax=Palleronia pelagia TaxID=387096 RepID=A0A1H8DI30_9RHOB|nr:FAD-binding oxidoreductase [Palleronia pelagia]SEN06825.1 FAD/FMN-containing dehydrogenase [Palleronia pelagia]
MSIDTISEGLRAIVGDAACKSGTDAARYYEDPRGSFTGKTCRVVLPETTGQVSRIVRFCNETGTPIIPHGGGTGVVAGQLSLESSDAIILSVERMNRVRGVSTDDFVMVAEAGCVLENIHAEAERHGMMFPLSMASKGSCTIGGNLATNAGGIQVLRHGNARDLCVGIEAVLPSGDVLEELSPLRKNNTGYDLRHLLIGSEGTLGVITAASLLLKPRDRATVTAFCAIASPADALMTLRALRSTIGDRLDGMELMSGLGVRLVREHFPTLKNPFRDEYPWYLLVETAGNPGLRDETETALAGCIEKGFVTDVVIAESQAQRDALWSLRENTPDANKKTGAFCSSDTSVPIGQIAAFVSRTHAAIAAVHDGLRTNSYGHIGDGNIHHNVFPPEGVGKTDFLDAHPGIAARVREAINEATLPLGGSISAEHGIGRLKPHDLQRHSSASKMAALRQIKRAMDPNNIMNPGALFSDLLP